MIILGVKLTHDGGLALIDNGRLIFSYEMEKINNNDRHSSFNIKVDEVEVILKTYGYSMNMIDQVAIDGWYDEAGGFYDKLEVDEKTTVKVASFEVAQYGSCVKNESILVASSHFNSDVGLPYNSYMHVAGHIFGAYCTSPFAKKNEDSFVLTWDGGMPPQLFYYHFGEKKLENLGHLFLISGYIYCTFPYEFEPFSSAYDEVSASIAGKAMAYVALGEARRDIIDKLKVIYHNLVKDTHVTDIKFSIVEVITKYFVEKAKEYAEEYQHKPADMIASCHVFLQELLVDELVSKVKNHPANYKNNLCFSGGSALNIKWNSAIRATEVFKEVWVPPFPNDSGSAIGVACCEMLLNGDCHILDWNVYSGPPLNNVVLAKGWESKACSVEELAVFLYENPEPIVCLHGRAELGPRALGNRSILSVATGSLKDKLNDIKNRESYRPVAPICLEEYAPDVFIPGTSDPYMLFEHIVNEKWQTTTPAICHLDKTSRLQTVNKEQNPVIYALLTHYHALSGIPLLCNTSANFNGKGFFPDVKSAMNWGGVNHIWSEGVMYSIV